MNTLNIDLHNDDGKLFTHFNYPGGEEQVRLTQEGQIAIGMAEHINVIARIRTPEHIVRIAHLKSALEGEIPNDDVMICLILPYFPYSRADRRFVSGDCHGLTVFFRLIDSMGFAEVRTLDMHNQLSDMTGLKDYSSDEFIREAIQQFCVPRGIFDLTILFPDKGAKTRYSIIGCVGNIHLYPVYAEKQRNPQNGLITHYSIPEQENEITPFVLVVDDICDGGATFEIISRTLEPKPKHIALYVTHGIFSKGLNPLVGYEKIYTTNSFYEKLTDGIQDKIHVFDCLPTLLEPH